jgi:hypothetical protein
MAYMSQEKKAKIAAALKLVVPKGWKYSLRVEHHSSLEMTISQAPIDLIAAWNEGGERRSFSAQGANVAKDYVQVNHYHLDTAFRGDLLATFRAIVAALNTDNHDNSDLQSDYHDVGHYLGLNIGRWNKPFVCTAPAADTVPSDGSSNLDGHWAA